MFCHFQEYELGIYPMQKGDLIEIDDFSELCELDPSYCGYEAQGQEKIRRKISWIGQYSRKEQKT